MNAPSYIDTHRWVQLVGFRVTADEILAARSSGATLTYDNARIDPEMTPHIRCFDCECLFDSKYAYRKCPGEVV